MAFQPGTTRVSLPPPNVKCSQFPATVAKPSSSYGFGFRPNRGAHAPHLGAGYWENRVPFLDSQRLAAAAPSRGMGVSVGEYLDSRYRRAEPVTPQNSVLSDGYLSGRCLESSKHDHLKSGLSKKPVQKVKNTKENKDHRMKGEAREIHRTQTINMEGDMTRRQNTPQEAKDFHDLFDHTGKTSDSKGNMRHFRWSTSALEDASKQAKPDQAESNEVNRKIGPRFKNLCVRSEFTFSTYDFYNKHNSDSWFSSSIPRRNNSPADTTLMDEESKITELRNYKRFFSHGRIEELVKV